MTSQALSKKLLDLLWGGSLAITFIFAALLILTLAVSLAVNARLFKIPDRVCYAGHVGSGVTQICT